MREVEREFIFAKAPFAQCHASTLVELADRSLLAAWFGGSREGSPDVAIWTARRPAGATAWEAPRVAADVPGVPCWNPVLYRDAADVVWLFYKVAPTIPAWTGYYRRSTDGGVTWEAPVPLPAGLLGPIKNKPVALSNGEILCPTSVESYGAWAAWVEVIGDGGARWQRFGPIGVPGEPYGIIQPTVWESTPGRLHLLARATQRIGAICAAISEDYGRTWSPAAPTPLPNPNSGIDAARLNDGRVLLCYNPTREGRTPLSLSLSTDNGATWSPPWHLETEPGEYSYPAVIQTADGRAHITYTHNRTRIAHVVVEIG
ncbi:MAG: exo-alpha-sialidase [Armatimonadetes bacterium]|nr:exo-alpha-sialidase [Armatimonadota bacterium]